MFGAIIIQMWNSGRLILTELILITPSAEPVDAHVHCFGKFGDNGIVYDPISG